jgi:leucyl-tRNA synthetase
VLVQINSKPKLRLNVDSSLDRAGLEQYVLGESKVVELLEGKQPKKIIAVPGKLVNLIV